MGKTYRTRGKGKKYREPFSPESVDDTLSCRKLRTDYKGVIIEYVWIGFSWLRIGISNGVFASSEERCGVLSSWVTVSFSMHSLPLAASS